jgi:hypothetical protein
MLAGAVRPLAMAPALAWFGIAQARPSAHGIFAFFGDLVIKNPDALIRTAQDCAARLLRRPVTHGSLLH